MKANYAFWFRKSTRGTQQENERQKKQLRAKENLILFNFCSKGGQRVDQIPQKNYENDILDYIDSQLYWKKFWVPWSNLGVGSNL